MHAHVALFAQRCQASSITHHIVVTHTAKERERERERGKHTHVDVPLQREPCVHLVYSNSAVSDTPSPFSPPLQ